MNTAARPPGHAGRQRVPRGRVRLDQRLVDLGLEPTRARARARILAGDVRLDDRVLDKPGALIPAEAVPVLRARPRFVSRGGEKLAGALDALAIDPEGLDCLDAGASTGGFTDCLLQRGARSVLALDVGYGQLAVTLRDDARVTVVERTNVRHFRPIEGRAQFDLVTADLSFISLTLVLPRLRELVLPGGRLLLMVKPQFELEKGEVGSGGVVRDPDLRERAIERVRAAASGVGLERLGESESVLRGPKGNLEHFLLLQRDPASAEGAGSELHAGERQEDP